MSARVLAPSDNASIDRGTCCNVRASTKIHDEHLDRLAMVYVRQSSPQQVLENRESRERQYGLAQFAQRLGWSGERVVIIDDDQGQSGKTADNRIGFQRLVTEVSLNHVGIVLGLELSRLSRSSKDWHQLIDVCRVFNTLLCDEDAVYDPLDSNDRLLLGMRGAMSEYELVTLRNRLLRGSQNKAKRGELFLLVPIGYVKLPTGEVIQEPDEQAREMVQLVFDKFQELGSAYAVFRYLITNNLELGFRRQRGARRGELEWRRPTPAKILFMLRHPIYAGAYAYGIHRAGKKNPITGGTEGGCWFLPPEEMSVLIRDRLPRYISWEQYLSNLEQLKQNRSMRESRGVPRRGAALLAGLVACGKCGYHMATKYSDEKQPAYECYQYGQHPIESSCGRVNAKVVDELVAHQTLRALEPASLTLSLEAAANVEGERRRLHEQWSKKLERARQNVERAERQYNAVEPENRLVGRTLEKRWEEALNAQRDVEEEYQRFAARLPVTLDDRDRERILALTENVATLWAASEASMADRKQIIRCLVQKVLIYPDKCSEYVGVQIHWQGGFCTQHQVTRAVGCYEQLRDYEQLKERVCRLHSEGLHVSQIAEKLNEEGFVPPRRRGKFTVGVLNPLMNRLGLVGELFRDEMLGDDEWWIPDLARKLKVIPQKIIYWAKQGWVHSRRTPSGKHWIVWADTDEIRRLHRLSSKKNSWIATRHPELVTPKRRVTG